MSQRSLLLVFRRAPYGGSSGRAGLDLAMAAAAFEQPVSLLFMDCLLYTSPSPRDA